MKVWGFDDFVNRPMGVVRKLNRVVGKVGKEGKGRVCFVTILGFAGRREAWKECKGRV